MSMDAQKDQFLFDNLMTNNRDVIYFKDLDSRFIQANEACVRKHGFKSAEEMIGKSDYDFYAEEHASQAFADEQKVMMTGEPLTGIEEKEVWPDGRVTWVSSSKMPLRNEEGKIIGIFGITRDITKHKNAVLKAQRYAEEMRHIKEEMEEDVRMAGQLQKSFTPGGYPVFPEDVPSEESCVEFLHQEILCDEVGGDFCSINKLSDHEVSLLICDVKGIGVRSALAIALIRGIMQEIIELARMPGAYLGRMNELLLPVLGQMSDLDVTGCHIV